MTLLYYFLRGLNNGGSKEMAILFSVILGPIVFIVLFFQLRDDFITDRDNRKKEKSKINFTKIYYEQLTTLGWDISFQHTLNGCILSNAFIKEFENKILLVNLTINNIPIIYKKVNSIFIPAGNIKLNDDTLNLMINYLNSFEK